MKGRLEILLIHNRLGNAGCLEVHLQLFGPRALRSCGWFLTLDGQVLAEITRLALDCLLCIYSPSMHRLCARHTPY